MIGRGILLDNGNINNTRGDKNESLRFALSAGNH